MSKNTNKQNHFQTHEDGYMLLAIIITWLIFSIGVFSLSAFEIATTTITLSLATFTLILVDTHKTQNRNSDIQNKIQLLQIEQMRLEQEENIARENKGNTDSDENDKILTEIKQQKAEWLKRLKQLKQDIDQMTN